MKTFKWTMPTFRHPEIEAKPLKVMNTECPSCSEEMDQGKVRVEGTAGGFALFGLSYKHLFFHGRNRRQEAVLKNNQWANALRCESCGITMIQEQ